LAIDDFGIGYSSMARLRDIPFTELKIDRSFLEGLSNHPHQRAIVESMIGLAHRLGMHTVAEGVDGEPESRHAQFGQILEQRAFGRV
ncbi:EAL domain-containing protein, partial [Xylella fastidiosa subsp. multiplex]|nr:EAL domain-containing protein [Xylella fastidiosa subsp. multiplex]